VQFPDLIPILQVAIGPVILISGVGLLLLTMTNRFGRIIDRTRHLSRELRSAQSPEPDRVLAQLEILLTRARIVRGAIAAASVSVLLAAVLIIVMFIGALFRLPSAALIVALFTSCLASLIGSLVLFIREVNLSLGALRLEVGTPGESRDLIMKRTT
jgi:Protein of unknown function (DUF2721)